jgi:hypothetical protein
VDVVENNSDNGDFQAEARIKNANILNLVVSPYLVCLW